RAESSCNRVAKLEQETQAGKPTIEQHMERVALAVGDDNTTKILVIAGRKDWSGERRMEEIIRLDGRYAGKNSNKLATLLGVTPAAVRGYGIWKQIQAKKASD